MKPKRTPAEIQAYLRSVRDSFPCACGATIHVFFDRPLLTYRHGDGEAMLEMPDYDVEDDAQMAESNRLFDGWIDSVHDYESRLTEC